MNNISKNLCIKIKPIMPSQTSDWRMESCQTTLHLINMFWVVNIQNYGIEYR